MRHFNITCYTSLVVLTVAPAWRSFLTTREWPLRDAIISAVFPNCEEECVHADQSSCVVTSYSECPLNGGL